MEDALLMSSGGVMAAALWCLLLCVSLNLILRIPAVRLGLVDAPGGRKQHAGNVPLIGGVSIALAFSFGAYLLSVPPRYAPLFAGIALLLACGLVDDLRDMRSSVKFGVQLLAAALMMTWGGLLVTDLGNVFGLALVLNGWGYVFTLVVVVGLINAINMMDGVDGLAGGVVLGSMFWLAVIALLSHQMMPAMMVLTLGAALVGFLVFNLRHPWRPRATVFLGDAGSLVLGFALAWFAVEISQYQQISLSPFLIAWVLALPVIDTVSLMFRRLYQGRSPFSADREHLHHLLLDSGMSSSSVTLCLMGLNFAIGGLGVAAGWLDVPDTLLFTGFMLMIAGHGLAVARLRRLRIAARPGGVMI